MISTDRRAVPLVGIVYVLSALAMATVGVIVPSMAAYATRLDTSPAAIGFAIALFSAPPAILATIGGSVIDRFGLKRSMMLAIGIIIAGDLVAFAAPTLMAFDLGLLTIGLGYAGIAVSAPALLIATLHGPTRIRGMSFWSTYAPVGFAIGLLIAALFADGAHWRYALVLHMILLAVAGVCGAIILPAPKPGTSPAGESAGQRIAGMLAVFREWPVLRLGIAVAMPNAISYGTSLVAPSYLAKAHDVSVAASSTTVAMAKIFAMLVGGIVMGHLLARKGNSVRIFTTVAAIGCVAQCLLYYPGSSFVVATGALVLWLFAFGGMAGTAMAMLPGVIRDPARGAAASGVVNQCISLASFAAPSIYFGVSGWIGLVGLAWGGLLVSVALLPGRRWSAPAAAAPLHTAV